ncbi:MAG: 50S ribosomal protein L10 [Chitinophagales bacterium]|jgi:large subunit ribosomal protein L10|nr:50S ribosomal protein L10 [Chitinophagales bacterium]MCO5281562.1 50S ribosomal protein L10 [Chitinophagales bacterium]OJV29903.1 MAG: 50S ribosomal protein L10 [Bacteroidetes bacterium 37-13]HRP39053.1 50S ribosomal protein L10 [Chitinophagales bacterium]
MTKAEKTQEIQDLKDKFSTAQYFYLTDSSSLSVEVINKFRRLCFSKGVEFRVAKNTLIKKALEQVGGQYEELFPILNGPTGILFSVEGAVPAKLLKEFRGADKQKPVLKGAYIDSSIFVGDNQLEALASLKSKNELLGEIVSLLQSPTQRVISALQGSSGQKIAGLVKALEERGE